MVMDRVMVKVRVVCKVYQNFSVISSQAFCEK